MVFINTCLDPLAHDHSSSCSSSSGSTSKMLSSISFATSTTPPFQRLCRVSMLLLLLTKSWKSPVKILFVTFWPKLILKDFYVRNTLYTKKAWNNQWNEISSDEKYLLWTYKLAKCVINFSSNQYWKHLFFLCDFVWTNHGYCSIT